ncbi:MAG: ABC transporter substrate-binding protein [Candidatus Caldarchaeales archaeon]
MVAITRSLLVVSVIVALVVGVAAGYGVALTTSPPPAAPVTVTTTVTTTAPGAPGLVGEVKIGALLALTGVLSSYGENSKVALELAEKEINEWLKARGEPWFIKIYVEDTATDPKTAMDKAMVLHGRGIKFFIGPMTSAEVSEIKSYADANKLLVISQSSTSPALAIPGDWVYRYCPTDVIQGPAAARVFFDAGVRYIVQAWRGDTWGDGLAHATEESFKKLLEKAGVEGGVTPGIRYDPAAKEFSAEAAKLAEIVEDLVKKHGKEKVGVSLIAFEEAVAFFAAAKAYPILAEVHWVGSDGTAGLAPIVKEKDAAELSVKVRFLNPIFAAGASPYKDKVEAYVREKLGRTPDTYAYAAYDIVWTLALALDHVDSYDSEAVRQHLPEVLKRYFGATGYFGLNPDGDRAFADYELWIPWPKDGEYDWKIAGIWNAVTDTITWSDWWLKATAK